jgi:hypothetical protein
MSLLFRPHRGSLEESLALVVELESWTALVDYVVEYVKPEREITANDVVLKYLGYDERCSWDTTLVSVKNYGVAGFAGIVK